jgi:MFS transporter, ACS family, allantoate permease
MSKEDPSPDLQATKSETEGQVDLRGAFLGRDYDVAAQFLVGLDSSITDEPISDKEARKLLWKIDLCVLPLISGSVILSAVDKNIISNAAIYGLTSDTGLTGNQFSWVGSIFFFGYLAFEWPMAYLIQRLPVAKFLAATILGWAVLAMCTAATQNFAGLATVRLFSKSLPLKQSISFTDDS